MILKVHLTEYLYLTIGLQNFTVYHCSWVMCFKKQNSTVLWFVNCKKKKVIVSFLLKWTVFGVFQVIKGLLKLWPKTCSQKEVSEISSLGEAVDCVIFYFCRTLFQVLVQCTMYLSNQWYQNYFCLVRCLSTA